MPPNSCPAIFKSSRVSCRSRRREHKASERTKPVAAQGSDEDYVIDNLTNRYTSVGGASLEYDYAWQVLCEYDGSDSIERIHVYGNYIDEVLFSLGFVEGAYYYAHDHLYSPVALLSSTGTVLKRCEYDSYGNCRKCPQDKRSFLILKTA